MMLTELLKLCRDHNDGTDDYWRIAIAQSPVCNRAVIRVIGDDWCSNRSPSAVIDTRDFSVLDKVGFDAIAAFLTAYSKKGHTA